MQVAVSMTGGPLRSALLTCLVLCCVPCGFAHIADVSLLTIFTDPSGVVSNVTVSQVDTFDIKMSHHD